MVGHGVVIPNQVDRKPGCGHEQQIGTGATDDLVREVDVTVSRIDGLRGDRHGHEHDSKPCRSPRFGLDSPVSGSQPRQVSRGERWFKQC